MTIFAPMPLLLICLGILLGPVVILAIHFYRASKMRLLPVRARAGRRSQVSSPQALEMREMLDAGMGNTDLMIEGESVTIGDQTFENVDMVALAQAIAASGSIFYGAEWCPHCTDTKALFGDGGKYLPFVEVSNPDHTANQIAIDNNISTFPTWDFPGDIRREGSLTIEEIVQLSGITIPTGESIRLESIANQTNLTGGQAFYIPLDGYSPTGSDITYTVSSSSGVINLSVMQGNKSLRMHSNSFGTMEFYLFEELASNATEQIAKLAESGFYDGLTFHRIIDNFVIQGGDPTGTGSGSSDLPDFDDQYHPWLRHNSRGLLSMAKSLDDTNNSQFFILENAAPHLDYQHTVFGMMTEGEAVRDSMSRTVVDGSDRPLFNVAMDNVEVFIDTENAVLRILVPEGVSGSDTITVTASDSSGNQTSQSFSVTYSPPTNAVNTMSFLSVVPDMTLKQGETKTHQLKANSLDGDVPVFYDEVRLFVVGAHVPVQVPAGLQYSVNQSTGLVEITATEQLAHGTYNLVVGVSDPLASGLTFSQKTSLIDYQVIQVTVAGSPDLNDDTVQLNEDESVTFNPLDNDAADVDPSSIRVVSSPSSGQVQVDYSTGDIVYTPAPDAVGTFTLRYIASSDQGVAGEVATVSLVIAPVNDESVAFDDKFLGDTNTSVLLPVLRNDRLGGPDESEGSVILSLPTVATAQGGNVSVNGSLVLYTPMAGFTGIDTFSYVINDGEFSSTATVSVNVSDPEAFSFTAVATPSTVDGLGVTSNQPQSDSIIDEWQSFYIEVWVAPGAAGGTGVSSAAATLNFDASMFTAQLVMIGPGFVQGSGTSISNTNGTVTLQGASAISNLGQSGRVLLGRVLFLPADGIAAPQIGQSLTLAFDQFLTSVSGLSLSAVGVGPVDQPSIDPTITTKLLPVVYDVNDDGSVGISDLAESIVAQGNPQSTLFTDFDLSGNFSVATVPYLLQAAGSSFDRFGGNTYLFTADLFALAISDSIITRQVAEIPSSDSINTLEVRELANSLPIIDTQDDALGVVIKITDLPGHQLAKTIGNVVYIDHNAAGHGWFVDTTPVDSEEFEWAASQTSQFAKPGSGAAGKIDLVSVLVHELMHVAGHSHEEGGINSPVIEVGQRLVDWDQIELDDQFYVSAIDQLFSEDDPA